MKHVTTMSRNCMTRALSITLILGLLLSSLAFSPNLSEIFNTNVQAVGDGYWTDDGNYVTAWYYDHPDESTYKIGTAEELAGLAKLVNDETDTFAGKTIKLTDDINLGEHEWVPIGVDYTKPFKGNFDGDNKTISNMHIGTSEAPADYKYAGLFGCVRPDTGKEVTIQNVNIDENSWVYSSVFGEGDVNYAGGICAAAGNHIYSSDDIDNATITISNCSNGGSITANNSSDDSAALAGGICAKAAFSNDSSTITISNCSNSGTITASVQHFFDTATAAGGICAEAYTKAKLTISNCSNSGSVTAKSPASTIHVDAGGICAQARAHAYAKNNTEATLTISNCSNSGNIESSSHKRVVTGGICAYAEAKAKDNAEATLTISNCSNSGNITASAEEGSFNSTADAGGICANAGASSNSSLKIINCNNSAGIYSSATSSYYGRAYAGGICVYSERLTISNCSNSGNITASIKKTSSKEAHACAGGICVSAPESKISNCYYKEGTATRGIGNRDDQAGKTIALPESQMKATTGTKDVEDWVDITIDGNDQEKMALVDALNYYVDTNLNNGLLINNGLLNWIQDDDVNDGYPTIKTNDNNAATDDVVVEDNTD